jgi:two-component system OmpR family response regulator
MLRILLIDDEVALTRLFKRALEQTGECEVRIANSGTQGLAALREFRPDLVFLDIIMPDMRGTDVLAAMRADPQFDGIRVVFLTAVPPHDRLVSGDPAHERSLLAGCPYLAKPVTAVEALAEARRVMSL